MTRDAILRHVIKSKKPRGEYLRKEGRKPVDKDDLHSLKL